MEEDEDRLFLSSLGVTSANPEDIERDVLAAAAENDGGNSTETEGSNEEEPIDQSESNDPSSTCQEKLYNKLRAVEFEIDAVASTVDHARRVSSKEDNNIDDGGSTEQGDREDDKSSVQASLNDMTLQHALTADRIKSLEKTKAQLEKELSRFQKEKTSKGIERDKFIQDLVKEEPRPKKKSKEAQKPGKNRSKRQKTASVDDDFDFDSVLDAASAGFVETKRDELVRKGILTPFHKLKGFERGIQQTGPSNWQNVPREEEDRSNDLFSASVDRAVRSMSEAAQARPSTKLLDPNFVPKLDGPTRPFQRLKTPFRIHESLESELEKKKGTKRKQKRPLPDKKWRKRISCEDTRLEENGDSRNSLITSSYEEEKQEDVENIDDNEPPFVTLEGALKIPESIFSNLFDYQKVGVQWLWELHCQRAGGVIGDEMGLGKTIQVLSFLGALHFSNMYKPSIVVCPVTLLRQWKREAEKWYPGFHVEILHDSAQDPGYRKKRARSSDTDDDSEISLDSDNGGNLTSKTLKKWDFLINRVLRSESGLLITTYEQLRSLGEKLLDIEWGYAVLDEGHRIRNPNAEITLVCKQLQTVHRIIMTGAPIQNKLTELWSLFDFVFPGKLGVLPVFEAEFSVPIAVGGYANASPLQVSTAYRCAVVLRDLIMPYLLRRMKEDVNAQLPKKTEHVLFCSLTAEQLSAYRSFLASSEVEQILDGNRNSLYGIDVMRKICNHPDLLEREHSCQNPDYGNPERSGKMKVVAQVLKVWKDQGHRVLLFSQTQQMLDIIESFMITSDYDYRRMDGLTPVKQRMALIDEFNNSSDVFIFILTTKVGGLGTNLTGANRVIIFDPDWNPSTDIQARERAWRIGQKRDVTVYRLITRGTIEEKVYHRQIYKHFLTNKILKNPQQRRFFKARDMKDLFTLNDDGNGGSTETSNIFSQLSEAVNVVGAQKDTQQDKQKHKKDAAAIADDARGDLENNLEIGSSRRKGKEKADNSGDEEEEETNILKSMFDAYGIHSAVNHDAIMNAHDEEKMRLEEQASQVAQRAAEALRQSRMLRNREDIYVPTWTGKSGTAGAPSTIRQKFGSTVNSQLIKPSSDGSSSNKTSEFKGFTAGAAAGKALSSAELLARIRGNQEKAVGAGLARQIELAPSSANGARSMNTRTSWSSKSLSGVQPEILIRKICTFIQERGGSSDSGSIVQHFKDRIPSKDLPLFKNLLKEIATLQKDPSGSRWVLKPEFIFTEKGRLVDYNGVEKLVQLMVPNRSDKKIDLVCRSLLAGVVAATDKFDCLNWFVQLRGLPVFDEWLQEVHKGKIGDSSSPKDGDKSVEEFLLILLRALDKLPVNLHALQMCNIGKSVNHLRTHKNVEIQKKSRSLVDMWKKRVEAEMDAKSGSNQAVSLTARPRVPEVPHSGNRQSGGSSEVAIKSLVAQPAAAKTASLKLVQGDTLTKSTFLSPVSMKSTSIIALGSTNPKDGQPRNAAYGAGSSDVPSSPAKDEKSSSSSQSLNNGQSSSGDHAKTGGFSGKEDARSSATVSMTLNKTSAASSRSRKSVNGFPGAAPSGVQRETGLSKNSSLHRNSASDRPLQPSVTCEKALDVPVVEGSNPKIIVKIPNRGRSPAQNSSGGSVEDPPSVTNSRTSSPVLSEKQNQFDHNFKEKNDAVRADISSNVNSESWQSNNVKKDAAACPEAGSGSPAVLPGEKGCKTGDNARKVVEDSEDTSLPPGYEFKDVKLHESSLNSMNALIESCVKYSEANVSAPVGDDIGMNLLASVATGEMPKSDGVSPVGSPPRTPVHEPLCDDNDSSVKPFTGDYSTDRAVDENEKLVMDRNLWAKNAESNTEKSAGDLTAHISTSPADMQQTGDPCQENTENSKEIVMAEETPDGVGRNPEEDKAGIGVDAGGTPYTKQKINGSLLTEDKVSESTQGVDTEAVEGSSSHRSLEFEGENKKAGSEGLNSSGQTEKNPLQSESLKGKDGESLHTSGPGEDMGPENIDEVKAEKADEVDSKSHVNQNEEQKSEWKSNTPVIQEDPAVPHVGSADKEGKGKSDHMENFEVEVKEQCCAGRSPPDESTALQAQEAGQHVMTGAPKLTASDGGKAQESTSITKDASCSARGISDTEAKVKFDLNEGFDGDDGKYGESCNFTSPRCSGAAQQLVSPFPLPVSSVSSSLPALITVAAAAKGPFVPPEDLLRSKRELGWKGSAATSAFRPAEPRKVLEMPLGATNISLPDATPGKHSRPPLDIDLNVPDERVLEDLASRISAQDTVSVSGLTNNRNGSWCEVMGSASVRGSGGLDLDLNRADELIDISNYSTSNGHKTDVPLQTGTSSGGLMNGEMSVRMDFDLNDGPVVDEVSAEPSVFHQHLRNVPSQLPVSGLRLSSAESGNFSSWFPRGNTYSTITVPSVLPDRGEQPFPFVTPGAPQRMLAPPHSSSPFGPDVFRASVLSSSPAAPFPSTPFQYPVFPFGTSFPFPPASFSGGSTTYVDSSSGGRLCFPAVNSQLMGPAGAVPSHFPRPYVVSLPDGSNSASTEGSLRWNRQVLDLNAGPGVPDIEGRDGTSSLVQRQLSVASSQILTEDQARIYQQMAGGHLKRKEPEGGWDGYKRPSWQ